MIFVYVLVFFWLVERERGKGPELSWSRVSHSWAGLDWCQLHWRGLTTTREGTAPCSSVLNLSDKFFLPISISLELQMPPVALVSRFYLYTHPQNVLCPLIADAENLWAWIDIHPGHNSFEVEKLARLWKLEHFEQMAALKQFARSTNSSPIVLTSWHLNQYTTITSSRQREPSDLSSWQ